MDRLGQLAWSLPRAALVPIVVGVAAAVLALLGPAVYLRDREPFKRLMEFLALVLGWPLPVRGEPLATPERPVPELRRVGSKSQIGSADGGRPGPPTRPVAF